MSYHTIPNTSDSDIQFSFLAKLNNNPFLPCKWEYFSRNMYELCESVCEHYYQYKAFMEPIAKICYLKEILPRIMKVFVIIYIEWMFIKYQSILWYLSSLNYDLVICTQNNDHKLYRLCAYSLKTCNIAALLQWPLQVYHDHLSNEIIHFSIYQQIHQLSRPDNTAQCQQGGGQ